jgi:ketosteroid isomerase-like protein
MSQENVEVVRRFHDTWRAGDRSAFRAIVDPAIEFRPDPDSLVAGGRSTRGRDAVERVLSEFIEQFDEYDVDPERFYDAGDRVVVTVRRRARAARSGLRLEDHFAQIFTLRRGQVVQIQSFRDTEDALQAAGLRE